jgi:hypothetical protein
MLLFFIFLAALFGVARLGWRRALGIALAAGIGTPIIILAATPIIMQHPPKAWTDGTWTWGPGCPAGMQLNWGNCVPPESVEPVDPKAFDASKFFPVVGDTPPAQPAPAPVPAEGPYEKSLRALLGEQLTPLN